MKSVTTARFRAALAALPAHVQLRARRAYETFLHDPAHPGLRLKQVHPTRLIYSARIGRRHRVLGVREGDTLIWYWIGTHAEYDQLVGALGR